MGERKNFLVWLNLPDNQVSLECEFKFVEHNGPGQFHNFYVVPKICDYGIPIPAAVDANFGVWLADEHSFSEAHQLSSARGPDVAQFLLQCVNQNISLCIFQIPKNTGYVTHSNPWAFRVADCALISSTKSFLSPIEKVMAHTGSTMTIGDVANIFNASVGVIASTLPFSEESINRLEFELERRFSFPWISLEAIVPRRLCVVMWSSIAAKRAAWATAKALGIKVVVISPDPWVKTDKSPHEYLLDGYIHVDLTTDSGFSQRLIHAIKNYPDPIDGICTPWDPFMVPTAQAAKDLNLYTSGPEPFSISTNKYLTRQMLDPGQKQYFTVASLKELELRLESSNSVSFPVVCKPAIGTLSWGVYRSDNPSQLREAVRNSLMVSEQTIDSRVLIEPYIDGPEVDCNIALLEGRVLYSEIVDDFPCAADLAKDPTGALFAETQAAVPSKLPKNEQRAITDVVAAAVRQQGFKTGVFHCEARIRNSSMKYVFSNGATVPDLEKVEENCSSKETSVYLHEINARMPGPMSSASSVIARGIDFWSLFLLYSIQEWRRYEAISVPFLSDEACDNVWLINCIVPVSIECIQPLFPGFSADQLYHQAIESCHSPLLELSKTHSHLTQYVLRHHVYIEPATRLGGKEGDWLWTTCMTLRSPISRQHALQVAQSFPKIYEDFVKQKYYRDPNDSISLRSHFV